MSSLVALVRHRGVLALALATLVVAVVARAQGKAAPIVEVFARMPGTHGAGGDAAPPKRVRIDLSTLPAETAELFDVQADTKRTYRGVRLSTVLKKAATAGGDRALLHFENGMAVPVALDKEGAPTVDPLIALAWKQENAVFSSDFPTVAKRAEVTLDPRPLTFTTNKVVVESPALDGLKDPSGTEFSPWRHVDSLKRIELVRGKSYDAQFSTTKADERVALGAQVYLMSCQYCHGVRDTGASYGWDFMLPFALHTHKKPKDLLTHVAVAKASALEKGLMMPTQKNLTQPEIEALWIWSFALAKDEALRPYAP